MSTAALNTATSKTAPAEYVEPTPAPVAEKNPNEETVNLDSHIVRGSQIIASVTLRKPMAGELRGVSLMELMQMDVGALRKVLPRISTPALLDADIARMDPADLVQLAVAVCGFLLQKSAKAESLGA